jgi:hypothetical protein
MTRCLPSPAKDRFTLCSGVNGQDAVIMGPVPRPDPPKAPRPIWHEGEDSKLPVLLVEIGDVANTPTYQFRPGAFAVFAPAEGGKLVLDGWSDDVLEDSQDPPGIIDQETYRLGWYYQYEDPEPDYLNAHVVQLSRVDQGYYAYQGSAANEEVTQCGFYNDLRTEENIAHTTVWESVEPGPPPEDVCGYTWAIPELMGGPGDGDYGSLERLFYMIKVGDELAYWWPEEFNQLLLSRNYSIRTGGLCRFNDTNNSCWNAAVKSGIGACAGILFENTASSMMIETVNTTRIWGAVYVANVRESGASNFPYTSGHTPTQTISTIYTGYARWFLQDGVYVNEDVSFFIQGLLRWSSGYIHDHTIRVSKREAADPDNLPNHLNGTWEAGMAGGGLFTRFQHPEELTERQLQILEGNEDDFEWLPGELSYYFEDADVSRDPGDIMVNCGGVEHYITSEWAIGSTTTSGVKNTQFRTARFKDYGIFTMPGTGINPETGKVDPETIEPIYAFSVELYNEGHSYGSEGEQRTIIYGMVVDDQ